MVQRRFLWCFLFLLFCDLCKRVCVLLHFPATPLVLPQFFGFFVLLLLLLFLKKNLYIKQRNGELEGRLEMLMENDYDCIGVERRLGWRI